MHFKTTNFNDRHKRDYQLYQYIHIHNRSHICLAAKDRFSILLNNNIVTVGPNK